MTMQTPTRRSKPAAMTPEAFKARRMKAGWTQEALAEKLGVAKNTITRYEMGLNPIPRLVVLALHTALARA